MIAVGLQWGVLDGLFNGVKRDNEAPILVDEESTPNGHSLDLIVLDFGAFLKKNPNFVSEWASHTGETALLGECVESEHLRLSLPLLARLDYRNRHGRSRFRFLTIGLSLSPFDHVVF